jgi:disease resistance protein RPM1
MDGKEGKKTTVKNLLTSVRDVAYEAEYLIEEFMIEGQRYAHLRALMIYNSYSKHIEEINSKISPLIELRKRYVSKIPCSSADQGSNSSHVNFGLRRASPYVNDDSIVGFAQHTNNLMKVLLGPEEKLQIIAITSMGGVGKTTLASMLYNEAHGVEDSYPTDIRLGNHPKESSSNTMTTKYFEFCAWVNVGPDPHMPTLLRVILAQVGYKIESLNKDLPISNVEDKLSTHYNVLYLSSCLRWFLEQRRYLIVLDDLWSPDVWKPLMLLAFPDLRNRSRILSTSRQKGFPVSVSTSSYTYELGSLSEEESWQLFLNKAFPQSKQQSSISCPKELQDLGRELSKRCDEHAKERKALQSIHAKETQAFQSIHSSN